MNDIGRLAPTPTGHLHLGHALTFSMAHRRAVEAGGRILLRMEDLDPQRCTQGFSRDAVDDLLWLGLEWTGEPVFQSHRRHLYLAAWQRLKEAGLIYPCCPSRKAISSLAPHDE